MRLTLVLLALALGGCNLSKCQFGEGGACTTDADCVLAHCTDSGCNCGCGVAVARSRLGKEHPCLQAEGEAPASGCTPTGPVCKCASAPCETSRAVCDNGRCSTRLGQADGGP